MLKASDLPPSVRRRVTRALASKPAMKNDNLTGSLFPTRAGVQVKRRAPLRVKGAALSPAQRLGEDQHLIDFVGWSRDNARRYSSALWHPGSFHVQNEGKMSSKAEAGKQVAMGKRAGVADWLNLLPGRMLAEQFRYLSIEFKVRDGELRENQREFFDMVVSAGGSAHVVWCKPEAALITLWYFGLTTERYLILSAGDPATYLVPRLGGHDERCPCGLKICASVRALLSEGKR